MRAHYLQHVPFEGLGSVEDWLKSAGYEVTCTRFFEGEKLPDPGRLNLLVVMGGPMSVNQEDEFPWLGEEKQFLRRAIQLGVPLLGICLGAQLVASALGSRVYRNLRKEIGWFPIENVTPPGGPTFRFPDSLEVFHWHGETFDLPPGAVRLARSEACENQAFQIGRSVIGLQFHLEITPDLLLEMVSHGLGELQPASYVQPESVLRSATTEKYRLINRWMGEVLAFLTTGKG